MIICHHQPRNVVQLFMYSLVSKPTRCWKVRWGSCLSYVPLSGVHPIPGGADQAGGGGRGGGRGGGGRGGGPRAQHHLGGARRTLTFWMRFYICYTPHCTLLILKLFNRESGIKPDQTCSQEFFIPVCRIQKKLTKNIFTERGTNKLPFVILQCTM